MKTVIDSSVILAGLLEQEDFVLPMEMFADAIMSTVNVEEIYGVLSRNGLDTEPAEDVLSDARIEIVPLSLGVARAAGRLEALTKTAGLSLGDRCCLGLARETGARILTADRAWAQFADALGIEIRLIR
jgi:ribonuclease VapC